LLPPRPHSPALRCAPPARSLCPPPSSFPLHHPPTPATSPLSLHDALPISSVALRGADGTHGHTILRQAGRVVDPHHRQAAQWTRSEEHTSELQSLTNLVCRLLLEKKKCS